MENATYTTDNSLGGAADESLCKYFTPETEDACHDFLGGLKEATAVRYMKAIRGICEYFKKDFASLTTADFHRYFDNYLRMLCEQKKEISTSSVSIAYWACNGLLMALAPGNAEGRSQHPKIAGCWHPFENSILTYEALPDEERIRAFLDVVSTDPVYDLCAHLSYECGLSTDEILALTLHDVAHRKDMYFFCKQKKRQLPVATAVALDKYLEVRPQPKDEAFANMLLVSRRKKGFTPENLRFHFRSVCPDIELRIPLSTLRTLWIYNNVSASGNPVERMEVADYIGVTDKYIDRIHNRVSKEEIRLPSQMLMLYEKFLSPETAKKLREEIEEKKQGGLER